MKKVLIATALSLCTTLVMAVPAKRNWTLVSQSDGTTIRISLVGDEHLHYYITEDYVPLYKAANNQYCYLSVEDGKLVASGILAHEVGLRTKQEQAVTTTMENLSSLATARRMEAKKRKRAQQLNSGQPYLKQDKNTFKGSKKAIVILAAFPDKSFSKSNEEIVKLYNDVLNQQGFSQFGAPGSVHDYFSTMSRGQFDLTFDVVGPVRVSKSSTYYGGPSALMGGTDHIGEFITEAVKNADAQFDIDWKRYDWDGNGEVEQIFVLYAGYGQATGGPTGTIWPNAWTLDEATANNDGNGGFSLDGVYINQYACSNELYSNSGKTIMGLGVFCHEFSHCMGLPDMYDTNYGKTPTMGDWDLMASGSYNGPNGLGWCPAGWTSYERAYAGWLSPIELQPNDMVQNMGALEDEDGPAYVIYNDNHKEEYYLLENHKHQGWDAYTPESGLLIIHVDYDKTLFDNNIVNTKGTFTPAQGYDGTYTNDHPRMAPFSRVRSISNETFFYTYPMNAPRGVIDSLTNTSNPAAILYNELADGTRLMGKPVYNIRKDEATGNISFSFMDKEAGQATTIREIDDMGEYGQASLYDTMGNRVGSYSQRSNGILRPGLYIVKGENTTKKILIK